MQVKLKFRRRKRLNGTKYETTYDTDASYGAGFIHSFLAYHWQRCETVLLKELWDMITMVESSIAAWSTTPWRQINVEDMELQFKRFAKDIRVLDKEVREDRRIRLRLIRAGCI